MKKQTKHTTKKWLAGMSAAAVTLSMFAASPLNQETANADPVADPQAVIKQLENEAWQARLFQLDDKILIGNSVVNVPASDKTEAIKVGDPMYLGGFSGLTHVEGDPANVFYTHTDRGPNGDIDAKACEGCKTFAVPTFSPQIVKVSLENGSIKVLDRIPLKLPNGAIDPITGTSNISGVSNFPDAKKTNDHLVGNGVADEVPVGSIEYNEDGTVKPGFTVLPNDPYALDLESITYDRSTDTFWMSEEYRPSIVQVKRDGTILQRIVPAGLKQKFIDANATAVPINESLPAVWSTRMPNRGIEGSSLTPDGKYLFAAIQSPMINPITANGKVNAASRAVRIIKLDVTQAVPTAVAEYVYVMDDVANVSNYISDMIAVDENHLIIDERDANYEFKKIFTADLTNATDFLGKLDNVGVVGEAAGSTLESAVVKGAVVDEHGQYTVTPVGGAVVSVMPIVKALKLDTKQFDYPNSKLEGIYMPNDHSILIANDNDFGVLDPDKIQMWMYTLSVPAESASTVASAGGTVSINTQNATGSTKDVQYTVNLQESAMLGTLLMKLPTGLTVSASDTVAFGGATARTVRASEIKENGAYLLLDGLTLQNGGSVTVTLKGKAASIDAAVLPDVQVDSDGPENGKSLSQTFALYSGSTGPYYPPVTTPDKPDKPDKPASMIDADQTGAVDADRLAASLAAFNEITISLAADTALLPAAGLTAAIQAGKSIHFVSPNGEYELPLAVLDAAQLAKTLGVNPDELTIKVTIAEASADIVRAAADLQGVSLASKPVEFNVQAFGKDGKTIDVPFGQAYVTRTIVLSGSIDPAHATGVMYDPETKTLKFVPTVFQTVAGQTTADIMRNGNSVYAVVTNNKSFADTASYWGKDDIALLADKLVIDGTSDGKFEPNRNVSRAEFAAMAVRALGLAASPSATDFSDVADAAWYAKEVGAAVNAGIITGYNDGTFRPNAQISREEIAVILVRALNYANVHLAVPANDQGAIIGAFKDAAKVGWSKPEIAAAVQAGLMKGYADGTVLPQGKATRGEAAAMIKRMLAKAHFINE
ncbi:esterase-like activity of phytase family protein [Paenibacillus sacheonensis]|uniref:SLH domain-containing protein n=1 Tax=Paenibacillus sacheonensis TaxID=742054 RepID=A0A7X4YPR2_9BACL|nr:esterase-like activity of phytase family protein [Paenibacillus sacheonensis]MBM7565626.1 hypothetical protein [Paenibacillus sacheonensis]NBC69456.1 hypothetical protein [Paenibacillus sacheonensis]